MILAKNVLSEFHAKIECINYKHKFEGRESRLSSAGSLYLSFFTK